MVVAKDSVWLEPFMMIDGQWILEVSWRSVCILLVQEY